MKIQVLGPGCPNCKRLEANVFEALGELDMTAEIEKVTSIDKIIEMGVMMTPALVINGKVVSSGRVLSKEEAKKILMEVK